MSAMAIVVLWGMFCSLRFAVLRMAGTCKLQPTEVP